MTLHSTGLPISDAPIDRGASSVSPPTDTYQLFLALYHRGEFSLGEYRLRLGFSAYHWAILVLDSKHDRYHAYDVTDGSSPDPLIRRDLNPDFQWTYRVKSNVRPESCDSLLIRMAIGEVSDGIGPETIKILLQSVQLPIKGAYPPQNCVNWIRAVLHKLHFHGYARRLQDVEMTIDRALAYADLRLLDPVNSVTLVDHLGNEILQPFCMQ
ncbi:uncharacterized protein N7479_003534 [Penicillium vulpinum]|uniref:Uncharacterized protein n=1 Tax=Penicillium vulpinum TaxID=29845 RepID=A0A1V6RX61_9EURO|nr:uncharacterized protein N7479_003534 [Penicillium vulpinum]KAJ5963658.1 hypothetical protein N7479_003534 [Penicillium vulpinum]OQE06110.1 hypothetical protein PENVUL_c020G02994 [Penicillium vulpinum]